MTRKLTWLAAKLVGALFVLAGVVATTVAWGAYQADQAIERQGHTVEARVERKSDPPARGGDGAFLLEYQFHTAEGQTIRTSRGVSRTLWENHEPGQSLMVRYDPDNPSRNFPVGEGVTSLALTLSVTAVGGVVVLIGLLLVVARNAPVTRDPDPSDPADDR